jgi:outer membrane receptor for ferrienterochelin and colicin
MKGFLKPVVFLGLLVSLVPGVFSADEGMSLADMSLEQLLQVKISVATKKALTPRETPSIVTLITREDIVNSGARDLVDVLTLLVPGVNFGSDVEGVVGIGLRGMWAHEGKILLLVDGQEQNEEQFATTQFGNHFPVNNIERIEIIRGPGSAIYGGYAELGVINIITKGFEQNGGDVTALYSEMDKTYSHRNIGFSYGKKQESLSYSINGVVSQGNRSDRDHVDVTGSALTMNGNSKLDDSNINMNINYKKFDFRVIMDQYHTTQIDLWGTNYTNGALKENFDSYYADLKYDFDKTGINGLKVTPEIKYKVQYPWNVSVMDQQYVNDKKVEKTIYGISSVWDINDKNNIVFGIEERTNYLSLPSSASVFDTFRSPTDKLTYNIFAAYVQWMMTSPLANLTLGGRYDNSDKYGTSFVPRIGLTKAWNEYHAKVMYSQSFRTPEGVIPDRAPLNTTIIPEKGNNYEIELGRTLGKDMFLVLNLFDMNFENVIVYQADSTGVGRYFNRDKMGSVGAEVTYQYEGKKASVKANYAYYESNQSNVSNYQVPGQDKYFLAFPLHRLNVLVGYKLNNMLSINPSVSFFGKRYGYAYDSSVAGLALKEFDEAAIVNLNFRVKNVLRDGLDMNVGVANIFDKEYDYIQPYNGGSAPLPAQTRAVYISASYKFN